MKLTRVIGESTELWRDIFSDRAGLLPRLALSVCTALGLLAAAFFVLGMINLNKRVDDEHVAIVLGLAGVLWCGALIRIWVRYRRFGRIIVGGLAVIAVWVLVIPMCFFIESITSYRGEFLIAGTIFFGFAMTALILLLTFYGMRRGKPVLRAGGAVDVMCPRCEYDLTGLRECRCPECGLEFTIDELIRVQGYELATQSVDSDEPRTLPAPDKTIGAADITPAPS